MDKDNIDISIICMTYNQIDYVKKMLEGILEQETKLIYEVIIHDDASMDGTKDYLYEIRNRFPNIIKLCIEDENKFSKEIDFFSEIVINIAKGKYIAICEGDDYWTDVNKLQRQYETLEAHPECDMCACRVDMISEDGNHILGEIRPREGDGILPIEDVIMGGGNYVATVGLFFRKTMFDHMMDFEKIRSLDYSHQIKGAIRGGICYIDKSMAAYRRYSKTSVTNMITNNINAMSRQCEQEKMILKTLDIETDGKYHNVIEKRLLDYEQSFYEQLKNRESELLELLKEVNGKQIFLWGMGPRGRNLERFLVEKKIKIKGVCDITVSQEEKKTVHGNPFFSCDEVMRRADVILTSVIGAYNFLINSDFKGTVINMQEYMPKA